MERRTRASQTTISAPPWRRPAAGIVALALFSLLTLSLAHAADAQPRTASATSANTPKVYQPSGKGTAIAHGIVDMAKLPVLQPHAITTVQQSPLPPLDALTPAQRQAYNDKARQTASTPIPGAQPTQPATGATPKFVGGGAVPLLVKQYDGLNSTQAGGGSGSAAIATDLSYVMEGTENAIAIYSAANGNKLYGPYAPASFFAPIKHAGALFANPQMYYDTMRDRWIVLYLEAIPDNSGTGVLTYLDIAISQSNSPTQPAPGAQYNLYQFSTNFEPISGADSFCGWATLGVDYYGVYITCANYRSDSFVGNTVLAINKAPMLTGSPNPTTYWWNDALKISGDSMPALALSPALEEGVQDAEFIVSTDAGFGIFSTNLSVCALTNQRNIATTQPTLSCLHKMLDFSYSDPFTVHQQGGSDFAVGFGTNQLYYKAGRLFLAWTGSSGIVPLGALHDIIHWTEVRPELAGNPQTLVGIEVTQQYYVAPPGNEDYYTPSIVGTDEDDIVLVFNRSGTSAYPGVAYTGRKASYAHNVMAGSANVINGTHATTTAWGKYSACAISLNSVTRGGIWCAAEYTGSIADPGWNTRLINLRAE